jgi:hypothetical protein
VAWFNGIMDDIFKNPIEKKGRIAIMRQLEDEIQNSFDDDWKGGIVIDFLPFSPYNTVHVLDIRSENRLEKLEDLSTIVRSLSEMWSHEIRLRPFCYAREKIDNCYRLRESDTCKLPEVDNFAKSFAKIILKWGAADHGDNSQQELP